MRRPTILRWFTLVLLTFGNFGLAAIVAAPAGAATGSAITTGGHHSCALVAKSGAVKCWGLNNHGQLGDRTWTNRSAPVGVAGLNSGIVAIDAGAAHTCALTKAGGVKCWGQNDSGELGDGIQIERADPVNVVGLSSGVAAISAGTGVSCAVTGSGGAKCWGRNDLGGIGDGTYQNRATPVDVLGLTSGVSAISAGGGHTCALTTTGAVYCWGNNNSGQLGTGATTATSGTPTQVVGLPSDITQISAGLGYSCALSPSTGVLCWGSNTFGQLGDGTTSDQPGPTPVTVQGLAPGTVTSVAAGGWHTCVVLVGGAAKCWGLNTSAGKLGDGTTTDSSTPVDVSGMSSGTAMVVPSILHHTCAATTSGVLKCWGYNGYGQVGDGTITNRPTPTTVSGFAK
jgi:alpha-tubulin suppressor-like RCC1 family protein